MNGYGWDKSLNVKTMGRSVFISLIRSRSRSCIRCWSGSTPRTVRNRDRCISFFIIQVKSIFRISYGMTGSYSWTRLRPRIFFRGRTRESGSWCSRWQCKCGFSLLGVFKATCVLNELSYRTRNGKNTRAFLN